MKGKKMKNLFTPDIIWSLVFCGVCLLILIIGRIQKKKYKD